MKSVADCVEDHLIMAHDFIPRRDADFLNWSRVFSTAINNSPASFGVSAAQASDYASLHDAFAVALRTSSNPATSSRANVFAKTTARRNAERSARLLARVIQATSTVTGAQKISIGLTVRDANPSAVPPPIDAPLLSIKLLYASTIRVTLRGKDTKRRGKPDGVAGAMVYSFVGNSPPDSLSQWKSEGGTTRPRIDITLTGENIRPGALVWFTAYWYNPRAQRGPVCTPKCTHIQCATMLMPDVAHRLAA